MKPVEPLEPVEPLKPVLLYVNELTASNIQTDVIYLLIDISKAFDSVLHNELLVKLWSMGISGNYQCVSVNDFISSLLQVKSGASQGSIFGPILFKLYMNDLPASTQCLQMIPSILNTSKAP